MRCHTEATGNALIRFTIDEHGIPRDFASSSRIIRIMHRMQLSQFANGCFNRTVVRPLESIAETEAQLETGLERSRRRHSASRRMSRAGGAQTRVQIRKEVRKDEG